VVSKSDSKQTIPQITLNILWVLIILYVIDSALDAAFPNFSFIPLETLILFLFSVVHGRIILGWRKILAMFTIVIVVSNLFENLSIAYGFPFGFYHYTTDLGPKLFSVPLLIGISYIGFAYVSWTLATYLVGDVFHKARSLGVLSVPIVAAFIISAGNFCFEPITSTVRGWWIWREGGGYFGVPLSNFMGWLLTTFTIFFLFALYQRLDKSVTSSMPVYSRRFHLAPALIYALTTVGFLVQYLFGENFKVTDASGQIWQTANIYEGTLIASIFTVLFMGVLTAFRLANLDTKKS
jgi:putative membrane protein